MWATRLFWKLALVYVALAATLTAIFLLAVAPRQLSSAGLGWSASAFAAGQVALALGFAYFLVRQIVGPVERLTRGAAALTAGNDGGAALAEGGHDVDLLGAAFNQMQVE